MPVVAASALLLTCGVGISSASAVDASAQSPASSSSTSGLVASRPAQVPANYLATPNGYFDPSCVYELKPNQVVVPDGSSEAIVTLTDEQARPVTSALLQADGKEAPASAGASVDLFGKLSTNAVKASPHVSACGHPQYTLSGALVDASAQSADSQKAATDSASTTPTVSGYVETADAKNLGNMSYLHAEWNVPAAPASQSSQTVYFFPGFENQTGGATIIMQPVLAWNQGGSGISGWSMASWNCCSVGNTYHSSYAAVTGSTVSGDVSGNGCSTSTGVCSSWAITTYDYGSQRSVTFNTNSGGRKMDWTFGGALEAYSLTACSQFPGTSVTFKNIYLEDVGNVRKYPSYARNVNSVTPSCGYSVTTGTNSATVNY